MSEPAEITIPDRTMTFEEFLAWAETVPKEAGRFELWDGRVIAKKGPAGSMNAERSQHWKMKAALYRALYNAVTRSGLEAHAVPEGATVKIPPNGRGVEPDTLVYLGPEVPRNTLVVPEPVIVCEVLSPSTARHDMSAKLEGYFELPSVQHYIIADPDRPMLIVHSRAAAGTLSTRLVSDPAETLRLDPPGLTVSLAEVLAG
jgi:Uma2 family endonuclease